MDKELVAGWFRFANMDLDLAKNTVKTMHPVPFELVCYHCQQSAEKFLKGTIIAFGIEVEKTHDLPTLMETLEEHTQITDDIFRIANSLTQFGVRTRYPNEISVDESQTKTAIAHAEKIKQWAEGEIAKIEETEKKAEEEKSSEQGNSKK